MKKASIIVPNPNFYLGAIHDSLNRKKYISISATLNRMMMNFN